MKDHLESSIFGEHDEHHVDAEPAPQPMSRREARELAEAQKKKGGGAKGKGKPSILRRLGVLVLALALVGGGVAVAYKYLKPVVEQFFVSNDYAGPGTGMVSFDVEQGQAGSAIGVALAKLDVVKSSKAFIEACEADPKCSSIQPGSYELRKQMKAVDALAVLVSADNRIVSRVVVPEGRWKSETFAILSKATGVPVADYVKASKDAAALGLPAAAKGNIEGYLFPAAYEFGPDTTAAEQLKEMVSEALQRMENLGVTPEKMQRLVIVASMVEAEARFPQDRAKVARVIENRLALPMRIQFDSTTSYAVQRRGVTTTPTERLTKSPWNTYWADGLPAGPIGNPGEGAIEAALKPAEGDWLFFVTTDPVAGTTKFSKTLAEHDRYVTEFNAWCEANPKTCTGK